MLHRELVVAVQDRGGAGDKVRTVVTRGEFLGPRHPADGALDKHGQKLGGGGVLLGSNATAPLIGECLFVANAFGGLVVTPGATATIVQCNGIAETRMGALTTSSGTVTMADGMHFNGARGDTQFVENEVSASERFGLLVNAARGTLFRNRGDENLYGIGLYGGSDLIGDLESIRGRDRVLPAAPSLAGGL